MSRKIDAVMALATEATLFSVAGSTTSKRFRSAKLSLACPSINCWEVESATKKIAHLT